MLALAGSSVVPSNKKNHLCSYLAEPQSSQSATVLALTGSSVAPPNKKIHFFVLGGATEESVRSSAGSDWILCVSSQQEKHFFVCGGATEESVRSSAGSDWIICASTQQEQTLFRIWEEPQRSQSEAMLALAGSSVALSDPNRIRLGT